MKEIYSNINIIGGGLIGLVSACSLSSLGYKVTILEKNPHYKLNQKNKDFRTTAISEGTKKFLDTIKLWKSIKMFAEPIKKINIVDRKKSNQLQFDNNRRSSNLGYIVENKILIDIFYKHLENNKNVKVFNNAEILNINNLNDAVLTKTQKFNHISDLNIAADGKKGFVKKFLKTPFFYKEYKKKALVIICKHSKNHFGTAFELFYKNGPLAILPMKKKGLNYLSSIVWTNETKYIDDLINLDNIRLMSILNEATQLSVGNINTIINKQTFSLSAHLNNSFYEKRTIYVGDSAHSFHPIAGQGWNLGMNDVKNLYYLSKKYLSLGIEVGDKHFCKQFHNENFYNAYRLFQITDKLDTIFQIQNPFFSLGRSVGLDYIQKNTKIKNKISDFAMGVN